MTSLQLFLLLILVLHADAGASPIEVKYEGEQPDAIYYSFDCDEQSINKFLRTQSGKKNALNMDLSKPVDSVAGLDLKLCKTLLGDGSANAGNFKSVPLRPADVTVPNMLYIRDLGCCMDANGCIGKGCFQPFMRCILKLQAVKNDKVLSDIPDTNLCGKCVQTNCFDGYCNNGQVRLIWIIEVTISLQCT